jgi:hypothetical protein
VRRVELGTTNQKGWCKRTKLGGVQESLLMRKRLTLRPEEEQTRVRWKRW